MRYPENPRRRVSAAFMSSPAVFDACHGLLSEHGIDIVTPDGLFDVLLVDLRPGQVGQARVPSLVSSARRLAGARPVLFLAGHEQFTMAELQTLASTETVIPAVASARVLTTAIRRSVSDVDRASEAALRLRAMAGLGMGVQTTGDMREGVDRALLFAEPSVQLLPVFGDLSVRTRTELVIHGSQTLQVLEHDQADALFILAARNRRPQSSLIRLLRRHSRLNSIPIIVIEPRADMRHMSYWASCGADAVIRPKELTLAVEIAGRIRRTRAASEGWNTLLQQSSLTDGAEPARLASPRFFEACLAERLSAAGRGDGCPFAVGALRIDPADGENHATARSEVAVYVSLALRSTDLVTRPAPDLFLVTLPNASKAEALKTMQALSRMITDLKFGSRTAAATFNARTSLVMASDASSAQSVISAALRELPAATAPLVLA
ncbi:hypothetical protein [Parvularcula sp. LCG005]|uniref:hypothetical protein n=1 Tax=Parvularcula sp. LCG005 TaxID=3078805 RepID=UPI0029424228|nr:hypothetical protein [Parvularcula sp. LCG005]WOI52246.1 hypothetical protein RUI03_08785 [Parvularcula sp. LCG005]